MVPYKHLFRSGGCRVTVKMDLELHLSFKNMAGGTAGPSRHSYNTDEAVAHLVADNDSDVEQLSSETETESSSEEEIDLESNYSERNREPVRRGGVRTTGGFNPARAAEILSNENRKELERLERIWKKKTNNQSYQILLHRVVLMQMSMKKQTLLIS